MSSEQEEKSTPRPWTWQSFGSGLMLTSCVPGRPIVMDFVRKGMHGAEPRFGKRTDSMGGIMVPLSEWESLPPDAQLIVTAVNERDQLLSSLAEKQVEIEKLRIALKGVDNALNRIAAGVRAADAVEQAFGIINTALNPISEPQEHEPESEKLNNA